MNKRNNYFFLLGLFFVVFLVVEFTDTYGDSGWFKTFLLILPAAFLIGGWTKKEKKNSDS